MKRKAANAIEVPSQKLDSRHCDWKSVKKDGYPPDNEEVYVTIEYSGGYRQTEYVYRHNSNPKRFCDMRTTAGKQFVKDHPNGYWEIYDDGHFELALDSVVAWMPYPEPYEGE